MLSFCAICIPLILDISVGLLWLFAASDKCCKMCLRDSMLTDLQLLDHCLKSI